MKTITSLISPFMTETSNTDNYEVIENEVLNDRNFKGLTLSGSLFSLTIFTNVSFKSCVFFAGRLENCKFINCEFINCKFQFTTTLHCNFQETVFKNCIWEASPTRKTKFYYCEMDYKSSYYLSKKSNKIINHAELTEEIIIHDDEDTPPSHEHLARDAA